MHPFSLSFLFTLFPIKRTDPVHQRQNVQYPSCVYFCRRDKRQLFNFATLLFPLFRVFSSSPGLPDCCWHTRPKRGKIYQITTKLPKGHKIQQMTVKYSHFFHSEAHQNLTQWRYLVWKYTIWQPCSSQFCVSTICQFPLPTSVRNLTRPHPRPATHPLSLPPSHPQLHAETLRGTREDIFKSYFSRMPFSKDRYYDH
jgi:hypothetical protein